MFNFMKKTVVKKDVESVSELPSVDVVVEAVSTSGYNVFDARFNLVAYAKTQDEAEKLSAEFSGSYRMVK
jgi:hypothetical protein